MAMANEDIGNIIQEGGVATKGTDMWSNTMVGTPSDAVGLYQSSSFEPERAMGRVALEMLNLQVIVRAVNPSNAYTRSMAIFNLLDRYKATRGGFFYTILARHHPHTIGEDENKRSRWSCNYKVMREVAP